MNKLLSNELNLLLLKEICSGNGLNINLSYLSKRLKRHRKTIRKKVKELLSYNIIDRPIFPFLGLFIEYPLLVAAYADLPENEEVRNWIKEDRNIFAAFRVRKGEYNTMLFEFHESVWSYHKWREKLVEEGKIPSREERVPSRPLYFSNRLIEKYEPHIGINLIENKLKESNRKFEINNYILSKDTFDILKCLVSSEGIKINENHLASVLKVHRKTVSNRILRMQKANIIYKPLCRFPTFFAPPGFLLVFSLVEVRKPREKVVLDILNDPHVSLAYRISEGRYNLLLFGAYSNIEDYLQWESMYDSKYPNCFGSIDNTYLIPKMALSIDQQKVSLGVIENKIKESQVG
ncbi:MAG: hypothetical protein NWF08_06010 [Candidatus Bathyarchaeota archaeon]|nr:hypothetical protein [Candidatus Bathyarchaeota archaeon]